MEMLMATIVTFCQFKTANITIDNKEKCMEFLVNCSITGSGQAPQNQIDKCKEKYLGFKK